MELDVLVNPEDITRMVVFDTWTLNCDRHHHDITVRKPNYDNVYLSSEGVEPGKRRLIAMDHGLCFIRSGEDLTKKLANIDKVQDEQFMGCFRSSAKSSAKDIIDSCAARLKEMDIDDRAGDDRNVPTEWEVSKEAREAWAELIYRRAGFVADNIREWIEAVAP